MIRNAATLAVQRGALLLIGVGYAIVVPRLLGPGDYGRFGLLISLMTWFFLLSDLGLGQALSRMLPEKLGSMNPQDRHNLLGSILLFRFFCGLVASSLFVLVARIFLHDLPLHLILLFALVAFTDALVEPLYSWQLGSNRADRWGMQFLLRRFLYLLLVPAGYMRAGLAGSAAGVLLAELAVFAAGLFWARGDIQMARIQMHESLLLPILQFGFVFYVGNLISSTYRYSGETLVRLATHDYRQVGFFSLCLSVYTATEAGFLQLNVAATPFLSQLQSTGQGPALRGWLERLLAALTALAVTAAFAMWFLADDLAPRVFGEAFRPATPNLALMGGALVASVTHGTASMMAVVLKRPAIYLVSAIARLVVFLSAGWILAGRLGSWGGCLALWLAAAAAALLGLAQVFFHFAFSPRRWIQSVLLAVPFLFLRPLGSGYAMFALAVLGYTAAIFATKTITAREAASAWRAIFQRGEKA